MMQTDESREHLWQVLHALCDGAVIADAYHEDARLWVSHPVGNLAGRTEIGGFWTALRRAFPDIERRTLIFVGGENQPDARFDGWRAPHLVAAMGHYQAMFKAPFLGIPASGNLVHLRFCEAHWFTQGRIRRSWIFLDLLDLARQAGRWPLPPSAGTEGLWPGPATNDGVRLGGDGGSDALAVVRKMHDALLSFDGRSLDSMPHEKFRKPNFMYYASAGIGMCRGAEGYRERHQAPFLGAFPDRSSAGHFIRVSDGDYAVTGGPVTGTHRNSYLGMTPTGRRIAVPVMDFYRIADGRIAESWLAIDIAGLADSLGNDLIARIARPGG